MPNILALVPNAVGQPRATRIYGQVSTHKPAPSNFSDPVYVVIPQWHDTYFYQFNDWPADHGNTLPAQGADCLIEIDDQRNMWLVRWKGAHS
jgi:hypothetical protein